MPRQRRGQVSDRWRRASVVIKKTALDEFANLRKAGLIAIVLREDDELIGVELTGDDDELMLGDAPGSWLFVSTRRISAPMGRNSMGVKSYRSGRKATRSSSCCAHRGRQAGARHHPEGLRQAHRRFDEFRVQSRGGKGIMAMRLTERDRTDGRAAAGA